MEVRWTDSADKHGVSHTDALNAIVRHLYRMPLDGQERTPGGPVPELFIGPGLSGRWLEVIAEASQGVLLVFHAMEARATVIEKARRAKEKG